MRTEQATSILTLIVVTLLIACSTSHTQPAATAQPNQPTASPANTASAGLPLRVLTDVPLGGATTRFDYQSLDSTSGRLYIAHLGSDLMTVFDVNKQAVIGEVRELKRVHGVLAYRSCIAFMRQQPEPMNWQLLMIKALALSLESPQAIILTASRTRAKQTRSMFRTSTGRLTPSSTRKRTRD